MARGTTISFPSTVDELDIEDAVFVKSYTSSGSIDALSAVYVDSSGNAVQCGTGTEEDAVGLATDDVATGVSVDVVHLGNIIPGFTGQTPGTKAYIQTTGAISTTVTSYPIGLFVSATQLFISKNV